jgi:hypothetical protein
MFKYAVVPVAVIGALVATTPGADDHRREAVAQLDAVCERLPLGRNVCGNAMDLVGGNLRYSNHLLWSTGRLGRVETFGMLGQVVVVAE